MVLGMSPGILPRLVPCRGMELGMGVRGYSTHKEPISLVILLINVISGQSSINITKRYECTHSLDHHILCSLEFKALFKIYILIKLDGAITR